VLLRGYNIAQAALPPSEAVQMLDSRSQAPLDDTGPEVENDLPSAANSMIAGVHRMQCWAGTVWLLVVVVGRRLDR
jgi:hypothetical protein